MVEEKKDEQQKPLIATAKDFVINNWGEICAWIVGGGLSQIDQGFTHFIPIGEELRSRAFAFALIASALVLLLVSAFYYGVVISLPTRIRWAVTAGIGVLSLLLSCVSYYLFLLADRWWKDPNSDFNFIYFFVVPLFYGMVFGFLSGSLLGATLLVADMFRRESDHRNRNSINTGQ